MLMIVKLEAFLYIVAIFSDSKKSRNPGDRAKSEDHFRREIHLGTLKKVYVFLVYKILVPNRHTWKC